MYRICLAVFLFITGCSTIDDTKLVKSDFPATINQISAVISNRVTKSIESFNGALIYPRSTQSDGKWKTVAIKDWTSGFFPGILWYTNELTSDDSFMRNAKRWTEGLKSLQSYAGSHDIGFMVNCSFGNGYRITKEIEYKKIMLQTAQTLMTRFNPKVGAIRSWDHSREKWQYPVIIDNMMNLELLFWASQNGGTRQMYDIAVSHAEKTMMNHFRHDGSTFHVVNYDTSNGNVISRETHQGFAHTSCWSRGQAWAIYGFTMAYRFTKDIRFLHTAQKAAEYFISNLPEDKIVYWDFNAPGIPNEPRDASAAAIASSALLELCNYGTDPLTKKKYLDEGTAILKSLTLPPYFEEKSESLGLLNRAVGNKPSNGEVNVSLIYGDYYFLEALIRIKNKESKFVSN